MMGNKKPACVHPEEEEGRKTPLTCSKGFGHQPGQIAGDFGPGEIIVVEGLDGWNNESLSHLPGVCSIPHLSRRLLGMSGLSPSHGVASPPRGSGREEGRAQTIGAGRGPPGRRPGKRSSAVRAASLPPPAGAAAALPGHRNVTAQRPSVRPPARPAEPPAPRARV